MSGFGMWETVKLACALALLFVVLYAQAFRAINGKG